MLPATVWAAVRLGLVALPEGSEAASLSAVEADFVSGNGATEGRAALSTRGVRYNGSTGHLWWHPCAASCSVSCRPRFVFFDRLDNAFRQLEQGPYLMECMHGLVGIAACERLLP